MMDWVRQMLLQQCERYPALQSGDLIKALHQSVFGCGHLVSGEADGLTYLEKEAQTARCAAVEPLGMYFCRVHLGILNETGLTAQTLFRLFCLSGQSLCGSEEEAEEGISALMELSEEGALPVPSAELNSAVCTWREAGYPACHHSPAFRAAYAPAYRVVRRTYAQAIPLLARIDRLMAQKERVTVAIEGGSASGKTTLAALLQKVYGCSVFHMDDFFLRPEQRTAERLSEPGGNVDRERFYQEVLVPLASGEDVVFRRYDCQTQSLGNPQCTVPRALNVVEGAYSMHPLLAPFYDLRVFMDISPELQEKRLFSRNGAVGAQNFLHRWIPLENAYFDALKPAARCDLILEAEA